jgi:ribonuclease Z
MQFSFTSLGCASALPTVNRFPSAHVLNVHERLFLIDCGEGCQIQLRKYGFSFLKIQNIFISHIHGDHIFGIFGLLSTMSMIGRTADIFIYAPAEFSDILKNFLKHFGEYFKFKVVHKVLSSKEPQIIYGGKNIEILSFPLNHRIDCYGFLFREKRPLNNIHKYVIEKYSLTLREIALLKNGENITREEGEILFNHDLTYSPYQPRSFAYCSDTAPFDKLPEYLAGVDLLYHEATFARDLEVMARKTMHSTASDAATTAVNAGAKKLLIGHYSSRYKDLNILLNEAREIFSETYLADEGKKYEIPLDKQTGISTQL